ncbi:TPA: restriction endonuclease subunit S [Aeromonas veronii]|uniref:restriction endonuclease subunit S n=1 Tax=uncultured Aeromonas sp. TaxID=263763 RepID=UPI002599DA91|nr:restriction endonuclease subunit S [uncultured Aeromonas sp.]
MSFEWSDSTIGDLVRSGEATIQTGPFGSQLHSYDYIESGTPVIPTEAIGRGRILDIPVPQVSTEKASELARHKLQIGDILFARRGAQATGLSAIVDKRYAGGLCGTGALLLRTNSARVLPHYLSLFLSGEFAFNWLRSHAVGAVMPNLNTDIIKALPLKLPPIEVQRELSRVFGALDDRIALLRETNATLEAIAQALFKSWFVDFDPVHSRARGEQPPGLAPEVVALFPDTFEESELGMVPKGWKLMPFGELLNHTIGGDWGDETPNDKNDTKVAIIRGTDMPDLQSGMIGRVPVRYTSQKKLATRKLQDGDLVLEVSGGSKDQPTGRSLYMTTGLLEKFDCPVEPASFCRLLRPISHEYGVLLSQHMTYIYADGKTWQYQNQSTGIANFQTTHFLETEVVAVPTDDVLKLFAETIRSMIDRSHLSQIAQLAALRDTLLPRLISGQLRLPDAEAMASEAQA